MAWKFSMKFLGVKFWSRDFGGLFEALGIFGGGLIFALIRSSPSLEIQRSPPGTYNSKILTRTWLIP